MAIRVKIKAKPKEQEQLNDVLDTWGKSGDEDFDTGLSEETASECRRKGGEFCYFYDKKTPTKTKPTPTTPTEPLKPAVKPPKKPKLPTKGGKQHESPSKA